MADTAQDLIGMDSAGSVFFARRRNDKRIQNSLDGFGIQIMKAIVLIFILPMSLHGASATGVEPQSCLDCHGNFSPKIIAAWENSKHAAHNVGCADCHGKNHSTIFTRQGQVSAAVCGACHARQQKEFDQSLHAAAIDVMRADPKFSRLSPTMAEAGCVGCHQIGNRFSDGSRGKCNSCHSGHGFSVAEASRPEACAQCHSGPDHPQMAAWQASKHGQLFADKETRAQAPTCVTCHMPKGTHNTGVGLSFGQVANGAVLENVKPPVKMRVLTEPEARRQRDNMVQTCLPCHSSRFAMDSLSQADAVKTEADALLEQAVKLITALDAEGLLERSGTTSYTKGSNTAQPMVLGLDQPYDGLSQIEQRFFDMFKFHHASTFKGAYHHSPEFTHNEGFLRMKQDLTYLNNEAARLRAEGRRKAANQKVSP